MVEKAIMHCLDVKWSIEPLLFLPHVKRGEVWAGHLSDPAAVLAHRDTSSFTVLLAVGARRQEVIPDGHPSGGGSAVPLHPGCSHR